MKPEYNKYVNMIRSQAWKRAKDTDHYMELVSRGNLAFAEAAASWDENRGAFSTYLFWKIRDHMGKRHNSTEEKRKMERISLSNDDSEQIMEFPSYNTPEDNVAFKMAITSMSKEAKEIVAIILESPVELFDWSLQTVKTTKKNIAKYLQAVGWEKTKIKKAFAELKEVFSQ